MRRSLALHGLVVLFVIILIAGCGITKKHWETALSTDTISAYEEFLRKHPKSEFENQAQSRLVHHGLQAVHSRESSKSLC
jgi:outer membrane protein assembly factor BamD (BamD/ComL family)